MMFLPSLSICRSRVMEVPPHMATLEKARWQARDLMRWATPCANSRVGTRTRAEGARLEEGLSTEEGGE